MPRSRRPTMVDSLKTLRKAGVEVATVLDVGVLTGTPALIKAFADVPHHLFEPVARHAPAIEKNYRQLNYRLHPVAVGEKDGSVWLCSWSIHGDDRITHAQVMSHEPDPDAVEGFVESSRIPLRALDSVMGEISAHGPYLLKVDVDGVELEVLTGAEKLLAECSVVVVEAPLTRLQRSAFFERAAALTSAGFSLMDIVDNAYYDGVLWQVDLVFVRNDLVQANPRLLPFEHEKFRFNGKLWQHSS